MSIRSLAIQLFIAVFLSITTIAWFLSMQSGQAIRLPLRTARTTFKASKEVIDQLTDIRDESVGLIQLWRKAQRLTNGAWLIAEYQQVKRKVCRGRVFNSKAVGDTCKGQGHSTLSRTHLTEYYNELVIQFRLAEHIYKASIEREIEEEYTKAALDNEAVVIKLLNQSILPALEFMIQLQGSTDTNCSTTEILANQIISQYSSCTVVQTSNMFFSQITLSLYHKLISKSLKHVDDKAQLYIPDSTKQWCLIL